MHAQPRPAILDAVEEGLAPGHRVLLHTVKAAVIYNNVEVLRQKLFESQTWFDGERHRSVMKPGVARCLLEGFDDIGSAAPVGSVAELCYVHGRVDMFREILECARPACVDQRDVTTDLNWLRFLCTRYSYGQYARASLLHVATFKVTLHSRDFIMMALEIDPNSDAISALKFSDPVAGALLTECEMALRIRQQQSQPPAPAGQPLPARARHRRL